MGAGRRRYGRPAVAGAAAAFLLWGGAWFFHGPLSLLLVVAAVAWTAVLPVSVLWSAWRRGRIEGVRGRFALAGVSAFLALVAVTVALLLVRGEFHQIDPTRRENLAPDPYLGHKVIVLPEQAAAGLSLDGSVGQRLERPDPTRRQIVLLGDSVLYGWGVENAETVGAYLGQMVRGFQVLNASVSGYSLDQYLMYLESIMPMLRPAVVVIGVFAGNDYESSGTSQWHGHSKPIFLLAEEQEPGPGVRGPGTGGRGLRSWRETIPPYDCVDVLSGSVLWTFIWRNAELGDWLLNALCRPKQLPVDVHEEVIRRTLDAIARLAARHGAATLFVLLPDRNDFCPDRWYAQQKSKYDRLAALLAEGERDVFLFKDALDLSCEQAYDAFLPDDSAHFTPGGNRRLAGFLAGELARRYGVR